MNTSSNLPGNSQGKSSLLDVYAPSLSGKPLMGASSAPHSPLTAEAIVAEAFPVAAALARASGRPLHIGLPMEISARVRAAALSRGMTAPALAASLLAGLTERPDLLDQVLEAAPKRTGQGRDLSGATALSRAVIYLAASHSGPDGWAHLAPKAVLSLAGIGSHSGIIAAMRRCHRRGLMELDMNGTRICAMRLTPSGAALAARLTGVAGIGGKA